MQKSGFTLLELSIVIVIIGLIVAGISAGQSLVRQANLRTVLTDAEKYKTAYNTFKLQYDAIPGDMANASDYWPGAGNGDGNGDIACTVGVTEENALFFLHLANAGIIDGSYSGDVPSCNTYSTPRPTIGTDLPAAPFNNSAYDVGNTIYNNVAEGKYFYFYRIQFSTPDNSWKGVVTASEAHALDKKSDDGIANEGKTHARADRQQWPDQGNTAVCTSSVYNNGTASDYDLSDTGENCAMSFSLQ